MLALITLLDGSNAAMFHVEHCGNRKWEYQVRWPESPAPEYRDWSEPRKTHGEGDLVPMLDPNVVPEVRWRWDDDVCGVGDLPPEEPWRDAVPREWGEVTCDFHVIIKQPRDFRADPLVHAAGLVRGRPVTFELNMPSRLVAQDGTEILTLRGTAITPGPSAVLRVEGEFISASDAFAISSVGISQVTLLPVPPAPPRSLPFRGCVAIKLGVLPPEEIELLRQYAAEQSQLESSRA